MKRFGNWGYGNDDDACPDAKEEAKFEFDIELSPGRLDDVDRPGSAECRAE